MTASSLCLFLIIVAFASYLQALTGFALGIFALGSVVALNISSMVTASMVVNVLMVVNVVIALWGNLRHVDFRLLMFSHLGMIPGGLVGIWLLQHMSEANSITLQVLLGILIIAAGATMAIRPQLKKSISNPHQFLLSGALGGVFGGLYSMPGPPVVYLFYRQPLALQTVRCTLLAVFGLLSVVRLLVLGWQGAVSTEVVTLAAYTVPVAIVTSLICSFIPSRMPEHAVRRGAFILLSGLGALVTFTAII